MNPSVVIAAGGDGTIRVVAGVLAGTGVPMGILPLGTGNLLARNLELPIDSLWNLVSIAVTGRDRRIDVGWVEAPEPDAEFSAPVRPKPDDLVGTGVGGKPAQQRGGGGQLGPYPDRAAIERAGAGPALAWMRPEDLFFLQIQGSGVLTFETGRRAKAVFAATNGKPFQGIANPMRDRGLLPANNTSGEAIRSWLADNRGPRADEIMRLNPRYVFFTLAPDDGRQPVGAAGIPLPPGRSIAVDTGLNALGGLYFIEGVAPTLSGAFPAYRRTVMALDAGGAIKGPVRADLYLGIGSQAGAEAGRVRHTLRMHRLVPKVGPYR